MQSTPKTPPLMALHHVSKRFEQPLDAAAHSPIC